MIHKKSWWTYKDVPAVYDSRKSRRARKPERVCIHRAGWFLFGIIPLYIYDVSVEQI